MQVRIRGLLLFVLLFVKTDYGAEIYQYRNTTGKKTVLTIMQIEPVDSLFRVQYTRAAVTHIAVCDSSGNTKLAFFRDRATQTEWKIFRQQDTLFVSGYIEGKPVEKQIRIDDSPWYQFLPFSLQLFSNTSDRAVRFWVIRPEDLRHTTMRATREECESLQISGDSCLTEKIKITLTGFLSRLWHGFYWFRESDNLFTRYEGRNGPPGSDWTTIELIR